MSERFDGYFDIIEEADGIYVQLIEGIDGGKTPHIDDIEKALISRKYTTYTLDGLKMKMIPGFASVKIRVSQGEVAFYGASETFKIDISEDKMSALITFYPTPENVTVKKSEIIDNLRARSVIYGIDEAMIDALIIEKEFNTPYVIAKGTPAIDGVVGSVEYFFKTTKDSRPDVDSEGNVNFHKLNIIASVQSGQLLARLTPSVEGEAGKNIQGNPIVPKKPKPVRIMVGKNTKLSDDRMEAFAAVAGLVKISDGKIVVYDVFDVPNNVGNSTGDIEFEGTVIVHGNVITGFSVIAKGDIEVHGVVEGATLISNGNIILHKGVQGMGKSKIEAAGDVMAKFIENANVTAGGKVHSEALLHSSITCKDSVVVEGKKGMISGGIVRAGNSVSAKVLGSHMGTATTIEVGMDPLLLQEYNAIRKDLPKLEDEVQKLDQVVNLLNKRKELAGELEPDKQEMYVSAVRNKIFLTNKITMSKKRIEELQVEVENKNSGTVTVLGNVYTGVKIVIGSANFYVRDELRYVKFYKNGLDVKMSSL